MQQQGRLQPGNSIDWCRILRILCCYYRCRYLILFVVCTALAGQSQSASFFRQSEEGFNKNSCLNMATSPLPTLTIKALLPKVLLFRKAFRIF